MLAAPVREFPYRPPRSGRGLTVISPRRYHFSFTTNLYNGKWLPVTETPFNFSLPWGSCITTVVRQSTSGTRRPSTSNCVTPNLSGTPTGAAAGMVHARYLYIEYGIGTCQYPTPPS
jgi:hypothetical protein